jgi:predicted small integral membrane protein
MQNLNIPRLSKSLLVAAVAFYYTLVVFNNITDYNSNYQFVHHVLTMDSTFPGNNGMWRAINSRLIHTLFFLSIIAWEAVTALLCWAAAAHLFAAQKKSAAEFKRAASFAIGSLTVGLLMWFVAFLSIGAEWFLMWQSRNWNGQEAAFRMFSILGIILLYLAQPEAE